MKLSMLVWLVLVLVQMCEWQFWQLFGWFLVNGELVNRVVVIGCSVSDMWNFFIMFVLVVQFRLICIVQVWVIMFRLSELILGMQLCMIWQCFLGIYGILLCCYFGWKFMFRKFSCSLLVIWVILLRWVLVFMYVWWMVFSVVLDNFSWLVGFSVIEVLLCSSVMVWLFFCIGVQLKWVKLLSRVLMLWLLLKVGGCRLFRWKLNFLCLVLMCYCVLGFLLEVSVVISLFWLVIGVLVMWLGFDKGRFVVFWLGWGCGDYVLVL